RLLNPGEGNPSGSRNRSYMSDASLGSLVSGRNANNTSSAAYEGGLATGLGRGNYDRSPAISCGCGAEAGTSNFSGAQQAEVSRETSRRIAGISRKRRSTSRSV